MSRCKFNCNRENLYTAFIKKLSEQTNKTVAAEALRQLEDFVVTGNKQLCHMDTVEMTAFVQHLHSLEAGGITADKVDHWINIICIFYDFLSDRGCLLINSLRELKRKEIKKLLEKMQENGFRLQSLEEEDDV